MKWPLKLIFFFIFFSFRFYTLVKAQSFYYKHYTVEDGLSGATVYCAMQDSKGYMWFGTETGACRFDGRRFTRFTTDDGLSDNEIFQIHEDSRGRIWFLTFNGKLSYFENHEFHNPDNDAVLKNAVAQSNLLLSFYEDHHKNIWIGTLNNGLFKINGVQVTNHDLISKDDYETGRYVVEDSSEKIWGIKAGHIVSMADGAASIREVIPFKAFKNCFHIPGGGIIYLRTDGSIYQLSNTVTQEHLLLRTSLDPYMIHNIYMDPVKNIWLCTSDNGCIRYSLIQGVYRKTEELLTGKTVYSVFVDKENNTWLTTAGEGIYMLPGDYRNFYSYSKEDGLSEMQINSIALDKSSNIWLGLGHGSVNVITHQGIKYFYTGGKQNYFNRINSILVDDRNSVWCAMDKGLMIFKNNIHSPPVLIDQLHTHALKNIIRNPVTKKIEATSSGGIVKIVADGSQPVGYRVEADSTFDRQRTFTHAYDHAGNCWIGTIEGLNFFNNETVLKYGPSAKVLQSRITDIAEFRKEVMVIATYGYGVLFFKDGKIVQQLTTGQDLAGNICRKLFVNDTLIWAATNFGLSKIICDEKNFHVVQNFNSKNGLLSDNVTAVADDGFNVYAATDRGLSVLRKNAQTSKMLPPNLYVTGVQTDHEAYHSTEVPDISWRNRRLLFEFTAVTFQNSTEVRYQYRLNGDPVWTETKNNYIEFSSLAPGNYIFELRAKKINSDWCSPAQVRFTIVPGFWQTTWFHFTILAAMICAVYIWVRYYSTRKLRLQLATVRQQKAIEAERNRIASDMHDDLGADLTKISIWGNIIGSEKEALDAIRPFSRQISATANSLLKKMDEIIWTLDPTNDTLISLVHYIHQYAHSFFEITPVRCYVSASELPDLQVTSAMRRNIFLAVKESMNNILKHSGANTVGVGIDADKNHIKITIVDNGKGFDLLSTSSARHGIMNLRKRLTDVGGTVEFRSKNRQGTILYMVIPLEAIDRRFMKE
jgi:signal transduction histidine kinase/ligand-binding sensor domain-containing protein